MAPADGGPVWRLTTLTGTDEKNPVFPVDTPLSTGYNLPMTYNTTVEYRRDGKIVATEKITVRGRWLTNCEAKAMAYAEAWLGVHNPDQIRFLMEEAGSGRLHALHWLSPCGVRA